MAEVRVIPYDDNLHRDQFYKLNLEYLTWVHNEVYTKYGKEVFPGGAVEEYLVEELPKFTEIEPPEGIVYVLEGGSEIFGMGVLKKLEDGVGEIKRMYVRPKYRGKGIGKVMLKRLEDKAREFGYSTLRLDTGAFMLAAQHVYRKAGFKEIEYYSGNEWAQDLAEGIGIYMEKKL